MSNTQKKRLTGAALIVMSSIIVSRITGFVREALIPNVLTARHGAAVSDAYGMAFRATDIMFSLLVGGAIAAALIPVLTGYIERNDEEEGWKAVGTFINVIFFSMIVVCTLGVIFSPQLVSFLARGFDEPTKALTIKLARILFPSVGFLMLAGLCNGVLNSYQRFAAASYGPSIYNLGGVLSLLLLSRFGVEAVTFGVLASAFVYFLFQLASALPNLKFYSFKLHLKNHGFQRLFKLALPSLLSSSILQLNIQITISFVTSFGQGSVTAFNMADKIWQLPLGIFAQGLGVAILPALSAKLAVGDTENFKRILTSGLKNVLLVAVPSAIGLITLNHTIIRTLLKFSNKLDEGIVTTAGNLLVFFSIALIAQSICSILNRAFYAANDTKTPLYIGTSTVAVNFILSILLKASALGIAGMTLAYSITSTVNAAILIFVLNKRVAGLELKKLFIFVLKVLSASLIMGAALYVINSILPAQNHIKLIQVLILALEVLSGVIIYFGIVLSIRVDEAVYMRNLAFSKLKQLTGIL